MAHLLVAAMLAVAGLKLVAVQALEAGELRADSARQRTTEISIPAERGAILDRTGAPLAFSVDARALVANPRMIAKNKGPNAAAYAAEMAAAIALATGQNQADLLALLTSDRGYVVLAKLVDPDVARALRERFPDIAVEQRESRQYPGGTLASSVVGMASWNADAHQLSGLVGLESAQDKLLAGADGVQVVDTAEDGTTIIPGSTRYERPAVPGSDIQLTIDADLQYTVQRLLSQEVARINPKGASVVVLDAKSGEVLAMANKNAFDPRDPASISGDQLGNAAVTTPYEPGSVAKIMTMAGVLEYGLARPDEVLQVPGHIKVADRTINDAWDHGTQPFTVTGVLSKSSNVGTIMLAQRLGEDRWSDMATRFGLGARTGVGLPGESAGRLPSRDSWSGSTFGNLPIGQGLSMTPLQVAGMFQTIANDGVRVPPRIVAATIGPGGVRTEAPRPTPVRVVSAQAATELRTMMTGVTQDAPGQTGTAPEAAVPGYQVAGKTGTAQQVDPGCGCYVRGRYWITFGGILPADHPRYVVLVMYDAPPGAEHAAPLFQEIAAYLTQRERLPVNTEQPPPLMLLPPH
ncbi:MAG: peptidoglycan D,D-transpeptidase FtsI family protein [Pseudonocardia sp.]